MRKFIILSLFLATYASAEVVTVLECNGEAGTIYTVGDWSNSDELNYEPGGRFGYADKAENYLLEYTNVVTSHDEAGQFTAQAYVRTDGNGWLEVAKLYNDHEEPEVFYGHVLVPKSKKDLQEFSPGITDEHFGLTLSEAQFVSAEEHLKELDTKDMTCRWATYESDAGPKAAFIKSEEEL